MPNKRTRLPNARQKATKPAKGEADRSDGKSDEVKVATQPVGIRPVQPRAKVMTTFPCEIGGHFAMPGREVKRTALESAPRP